MLLILCSDIAATYADIRNVYIRIRAKQQRNKILVVVKWINSAEETIIVKTQLWDLMQLPSSVVVDDILVLMILLLQRRIV